VKLPVVWLPEAERELREAVSWYSDIRPELGARFVYAVDETMEAIVDGPLRYATIHKNYRRAGVRRFPYGLFFIKEPDRIVVIACFHGKRNPQRWMTRQTHTF
jgi:plasmid stabilization system protein ParE